MTPAELLLTRGMLALVPTAEGIVIAADDDDAVIPLDQLPVLARFTRRSDRVFLFDEAKPVLRWLLARGVDVARPVCRSTLETLGGQRSDELGQAMAPSLEVARQRARDLLERLPARMARVEERGQRKVARLECLVLRAFNALEHRGLPIDKARWQALVTEEKTASSTARARVLELAGPLLPRDLFGMADINLDADADVRGLLQRATGKTLEDTSRFTLAALGHPIADALLTFRESWKIVTTYGDTFLAHVKDIDDDGVGRIRSTFVPLGASTGRVACRDPNLQNLPKDPRFHACLRAPRGRSLVTADYGTCELRIVAELAEDPVFLAAFARGEDLHSTVATSMFGVPVSKTENAELRQRAKAINFGLVYGMGPAALSTSLNVDRATGEELLARYFRTFPRVRDYLEGCVDVALKRGFSETVLGRRLFFDDATLSAPNARGELSRIMKNMPIQGCSADMTKLAMVRVHERLLEETRGSAGLVNTVHDELVVECDDVDGPGVSDIVREEMEEAHRTLLKKVPPFVELHLGPTWHH
ncbi:MAG: DNA polymerase [Deltaproteobacteria bacterium]|nr:DNA polymerase [Deltaproteobacteria bacterium]